jgi:hypothetical protein
MALVRVRHASLRLNGRKVAEMYDCTYHIASGDEPQYGDDGFIGMSDGAITSQIDCSTIVPISGMSVDIDGLVLNKSDVDIAHSLVNGKIHQVTMRCTDADYKSDAKNGTLMGSFKFFGGVPKRT